MKSAQKSAIKLRGHHLICLHFFKGEGYNPEFVKKLKNILKRIEYGEKIEVHSGADDVCKICPYLKGEKCDYEVDADAEIREMDRTATKLFKLKNQDRVTWLNIKKIIPEIFSWWSKKYCKECDWRKVCEAKNETLEDKF